MNAVRIVAPASALKEAALKRALVALESQVGAVAITDAAFAVSGRFAGNDAARARALVAGLSDPDASSLLCVQGGYGSGRLVDHLSGTALPAGQAIPTLIGYSDISHLGAVLHAQMRVPFVHGPMLVDFNDPAKHESCRRLCDYLRTGSFDATLAAYAALEPVVQGEAHGMLVGGNLSMICCLLGTPWQRLFDGAILIVEETFEFLYRLDRMMLHLRQAGVLDVVSGIIFGGFDRMQDSAVPFGASAREILLNAVAGFRGPVAWGAPFGHGPDNYPIPLYRPVCFSVGETTRLELIAGTTPKDF